MVLGEGPSKGSGVDSESEIQCEKNISGDTLGVWSNWNYSHNYSFLRTVNKA